MAKGDPSQPPVLLLIMINMFFKVLHIQDTSRNRNVCVYLFLMLQVAHMIVS